MKIKINLESWNLAHISTLVCTWKFRLIFINKWEEVNTYSVKPVLAELGKNTQLSWVELSWAQSGLFCIWNQNTYQLYCAHKNSNSQLSTAENYINLKSWNFAYIIFRVKIQIRFLSTNEKKLTPTQLSQS